jgi:hypothetical protein
MSEPNNDPYPVRCPLCGAAHAGMPKSRWELFSDEELHDINELLVKEIELNGCLCDSETVIKNEIDAELARRKKGES